MIELYEFPLSGNCHKVRLLLSLLGLDYRSHLLNGAEREQKTPAFLALNPFGQVPVLADGGTVLRDSQAILVYLARRYGGPDWWPDDPAALAGTVAWLSVAANEVAHGPNALRLHHRFGRPLDVPAAEATCAALLAVLEAHLGRHGWFGPGRLGIADLALYPYIALAPEGRVDLAPWPAIRAWLARIQCLPGHVAMPGLFDALAEAVR